MVKTPVVAAHAHDAPAGRLRHVVDVACEASVTEKLAAEPAATVIADGENWGVAPPEAEGESISNWKVLEAPPPDEELLTVTATTPGEAKPEAGTCAESRLDEM